MSAEHRRPLVAFVVVSILCALMLGHGIRTDALVGLLGSRVSSSAAQNEPTVTLRDTAPAVAPNSRATGLSGLSAERVVTASPSPSPTSAPTPTAIATATAVVQPAAPATVMTIPVTTPAPTSPPTAVNPEVSDRGDQPAVVTARKADRDAAKQARQAQKEADKATAAADKTTVTDAEKTTKDAEKALDVAARAAEKATKHALVPSALPTAVPAP